jgi:hypothetical protein
MRSRDEFWTNQDRQYAIGNNERDFNYGATQDLANRMERMYGNQADYATSAGDARASGLIGAGQHSMFGSILDAAGAGMQFAGANMGPPKPPGPIGSRNVPQGVMSQVGSAAMSAGNMGGGGQYNYPTPSRPPLPSRPINQQGMMSPR